MFFPFKILKTWAGGVAHVVECLARLGSEFTPHYHKNKQTKHLLKLTLICILKQITI
jgi:hypothetical protein